MKYFKLLGSLLTLLLLSNAAWAVSYDFGSSNPETIMNFIQGNSALVYLSAFFVLGILLAFTPCVLPMVPILSGIIVGQESLSTRKAFKLSVSYVFGMAITYAIAGMLAGFMGSTVQTLMQRPGVILAFCLIFILMALSMFGLFELRLPASLNARLNSLSKKSNKHNFASVAIMGVISTLVVSPCVTAPLIGVLTFIGQNGEVFTGGLILFVMALGMGLPLILVGAGYGSVLPKSGPWMVKIKQLFGVFMLAIAIWMSGRVLPASVLNYLWAALVLIASTVFICSKSPKGKISQLIQIVAIIGLVAGGVILYKASLPVLPIQEAQAETKTLPFTEIDSLTAIQQALEQAKQAKKPVILEFSASWCSDCQNMDSKVFNQADIKDAMGYSVNLRVEISEKTEEVDKIKKAFAIYGTPTILFFNSKGEALSQLSAVGFIDKKDMLKILNDAKAQS